jgi:MFS family permease
MMSVGMESHSKFSSTSRYLQKVAWLNTSLLYSSLASCATILTYGKLYSFFSPRAILASSIGIFVIGSILCATAPQSWTFVIGRAIAGLGNAGILSGGNMYCGLFLCILLKVSNTQILTELVPCRILTHITSVRSRPFYLGLIGSIECIALASAPLIAGAIAAVTSWRVCFYISVPCGFISIVMVFFVPRLPKDPQSCTLSAKIKQLDLLGMAIFIPTVVCFILALQWGGTIYPWRSTPVIILLILAGVMAIIFGIQQHYAGDNATIPTKILQSRVVIFGMVLMFSTSGALYIFTYYVKLFTSCWKNLP